VDQNRGDLPRSEGPGGCRLFSRLSHTRGIATSVGQRRKLSTRCASWVGVVSENTCSSDNRRRQHLACSERFGHSPVDLRQNLSPRPDLTRVRMEVTISPKLKATMTTVRNTRGLGEEMRLREPNPTMPHVSAGHGSCGHLASSLSVTEDGTRSTWKRIFNAACLTLLFCFRLCGAIDPEPTVPESVGVNIHFIDPQPGEMKMLAASGVRWVRMDFGWSRIETARGQYDFTAYDRLVALLEQYKIRPVFILCYVNALYDEGLSPHTDEGVQAFARWAAASVTHFKGRGIVWEMYNEPNFFFWRPKTNVEAYIKLALAVGEAIYEAAPDEDYIGPAGFGVDLPFLEACFKAGLLNYWSGVSIHPYRPMDPEAAAADFMAVRILIRRYARQGKQIPILSGEWGYPTNSDQTGVDEETQGRLLPRQWLNNLANDIPLSIWYDWHDDGPDPKEREHHFGIVRFTYDGARDPVYDPKPAYRAARTLTTFLEGFRFNKRLVVGGPNDYALLFSKGDAVRLVVWTTAPAPHPVSIPASPGPFSVVAHTGKKLPEVVADKGSLTVVATDAPKYLEPEKPNDLLRVAAAWMRAPLEVSTTAPKEVLLTLNLRNPLSKTLRVKTEPNFEAEAASGKDVSLSTSVKVLRAPDPIRVPIEWEFNGLGNIAQETHIHVTNPLRMNLFPVAGNILPVGVRNPTGESFDGEILLTDVAGLRCDPCSAPLSLKSGETAKTVRLTLGGSERVYRAGMLVKDSKGETVLVVAAARLASGDNFARYPSGGQPETYQLVPEGDAQVASEQALSVAAPPGGPPYPGLGCLKVVYHFAPGEKLIRVAPLAEDIKTIQGEPGSFGLWVYGDGGGNTLGLRFVDKTGQVFQEGDSLITWKGWRYALFPMGTALAKHWGRRR
jgi:polysaccharide biosynthesis protein PslG